MKKLSKKKVKERRKKGIVKAYMSRAAAIKKLQLPLADFRRLCILKGVYPVEPKNKSKLTGGNTRRKTYFFTRDIQFLMHEPIMYKFWEFKVFMKRLTRAKGRHDKEKFERVLDNKPIYKLDTVVKERYPRFIDALRDCDDALSMCFLFAMFPKGRGRPEDLIDLSRKLTLEFMHYVIETRSLRKVFISIKGYYYQAEISGQTVTWMVPHQFVIERTSNVDINVMKTFTEFYVTLLGFINFKLYQSINAAYPPQLVEESIKDSLKAASKGAESTGAKRALKRKRTEPDDDEDDEKEDSRDALIAALNRKIKILANKQVTNIEAQEQQIDSFESEEGDEKDTGDKMTVQQLMALENLFSGIKFFLNRETPRESLTFIIRAFGGEVSWDKSLFPGASFDESDPSITHQIIDRSSLDDRRVDRTYIQPQWVYDSINVRMLLPTSEYLIGATLPPHLSPFVSEKRGEYVPPDKVKLVELRKQFEAEKAAEDRINNGQADVEGELETDTEAERELDGGDQEESDRESTKRKRVRFDGKSAQNGKFNSLHQSKTEKNRKRRERDSNKSTPRSKMAAKEGKLHVEDKEELKRKEDAEYRKMGIMMIPKKKKRLFDRITKTNKQRNQKVERLRAKRRVVEEVRRRQRGRNKR